MGSLRPSPLFLCRLVPSSIDSRRELLDFATRGELFESVTLLVTAGKYCSAAERGRTGTSHGVPTINHDVQDARASQLVQLGKKAEPTRTIFQLNARNERAFEELSFASDRAKHVF